MVSDSSGGLPDSPAFELESPDFGEGDCLPLWARSGILGGGGEDRSPTLHWHDAPPATRSFVLTMYDPDATGGWWHWAVYDIPASLDSLPADAGNPDARLLPVGANTLPNQAGLERFVGAAPPAGDGEHRYVFTMTALDVERLDLPRGSSPVELEDAVRDHALGQARLIGVTETSRE